MRLWSKPFIYVVIHIIVGYFAYFHSELIVAIFGYQILQLLVGVRFFLFSWKIEPGNSIEHTLVKLLEYAVGYGIAFMMNKASNKV